MENFSQQCIFLLGAGASADADVPVSSGLNKIFRKKIEDDYPDEKDLHRQLYNFLIGTIYYHRGLKNQRPDEEVINFEEVLNLIYLLKKRDEVELAAFVGNWHEKLRAFSGEFLTEFEKWLRRLVVEKLNVQPDRVDYLKWFVELHKNKDSTIHIFTLNQDLSLEKCFKSANYQFCHGFDEQNIWNPDLFEGREAEGSNAINIYKLHGSIGWTQQENREIVFDESKGPSDRHLMIFGILEKFTIDEPFFELVKRLKEKANMASLIVIMGYGFQDEYINNIIFDSLRAEINKKLLIVDKDTERIKKRLRLPRYVKQYSPSVVEYYDCKEGLKKEMGLSGLLTKIEDLLKNLTKAPF